MSMDEQSSGSSENRSDGVVARSFPEIESATPGWENPAPIASLAGTSGQVASPSRFHAAPSNAYAAMPPLNADCEVGIDRAEGIPTRMRPLKKATLAPAAAEAVVAAAA